MGDILPEENEDLQLWLALLRTTLVVGGKERSLLAGWDLTPPQGAVLRILAEAEPEALMLSEISRRMLVTGGNLTGIVDRLEEAGFVERVPDQDDRRVIRARLTEAGRAVHRAVAPQHLQHLAQAFGRLNPRERKQLRRVLEKLTASVADPIAARP